MPPRTMLMPACEGDTDQSRRFGLEGSKSHKNKLAAFSKGDQRRKRWSNRDILCRCNCNRLLHYEQVEPSIECFESGRQSACNREQREDSGPGCKCERAAKIPPPSQRLASLTAACNPQALTTSTHSMASNGSGATSWASTCPAISASQQCFN